jgi:hypothetical protein
MKSIHHIPLLATFVRHTYYGLKWGEEKRNCEAENQKGKLLYSPVNILFFFLRKKKPPLTIIHPPWGISSR